MRTALVLRSALRPACLAVVAAMAVAACGNPDREEDVSGEPLEEVRDTLGEDTALSDDEVRGPPAVPTDSGLARGVEDPDADESEPGVVRPGDDTPWAGDREEGSGLPPWTTSRVAWDPPSAPPPPVIEVLRQGRNEGFDRWVVELRGEHLPGYRVQYVDEPLRACGSGNQIHPEGDAWLQLRMEPARGHTEAGDATIPTERATPELTRGVRIYRTCDFEAIVTLVLAVDSPEAFRAFHLRNPPRVVVDVQH